jgi:hypothetical protein
VTSPATDAKAPPEADGFEGFYGLAFDDNRTVRVAWYALPDHANHVYDLVDVLEVSRFGV